MGGGPEYGKAVSLGVMSGPTDLRESTARLDCVADRELLDKLVRFKHYMGICDSGPSEFLAKAALKHGDELLERNRSIIRENIKTADAFFAQTSGGIRGEDDGVRTCRVP